METFSISKGVKPKVLLVYLESWKWENARGIPYPLNFGLKEGLEINGNESLMIPSQLMGEVSQPDLSRSSWLWHFHTILKGKQFDQVWLEIVHSYLDEEFLQWITRTIPIRLGFIYESLQISEQEYEGNPQGSRRRTANVLKHLPYMTHVAVADEHDVSSLQKLSSISVIWSPALVGVPRFICDPIPQPTHAPAVFFGALYGKRQQWLEDPELKGLLIRPETSPEVYTDYPLLFDQLQGTVQKRLADNEPIDSLVLENYVSMMRTLREKLSRLFLKGFLAGCAVVNLPQFGRMYASRVVEGIAAGRPIIAAEIPDCPRAKSLFEDGKEILLYSPEEPAQLAGYIRQIQGDSNLARRLVDAAQRRLRTCYANDILVRQLLNWVQTGNEPKFGEEEFSSITTERNLAMDEIRMTNQDKCLDPKHDVLVQLQSLGLLEQGKPIRLHLGCGENRLEGYINIDYPPEAHSVMNIQADVYADVTALEFPPLSVDEIRSHHMFEHFPRTLALALLIRWHQWLKVDGTLRIETPDFEGSAKMFLQTDSLKVKMGIVRHLAGDQAANWAFHLDQWFPERFVRTFQALGFELTDIRPWKWTEAPYLANVEVSAVKRKAYPMSELLRRTDEVLWESTVAESEKSTYEIWRKQLRQILSNSVAKSMDADRNGNNFAVRPLPVEPEIGFSPKKQSSSQGKGGRNTSKPLLISECVQPGDLVFDVGANIGSKAQEFLKQGARVVCFEPQPECVHRLRERFADWAAVHIEEVGLADKPGDLELSLCSTAPTISTFAEEWKRGRFSEYSWGKKISVKVTTLDRMIERYGRPKFCKIDVEGFELSVLKGLSQPIPYLAFEFTIEFIENAQSCVAYLQVLGYQEFNFVLGERRSLSLSDWVGPDVLFNFIHQQKDELLWGDIYARMPNTLEEKETDSVPTVTGMPTQKQIHVENSLLLPVTLLDKLSQLSLPEIQGFNQHDRDEWVHAKARTVGVGARVLDVGAGTCPYRNVFSHCDYHTHDFKRYEGVKLGNTTEYGHIDYVSDITAIPVPDHSFDVILCSEVLEHVPEPMKALREMARILKPEGRLFLTAPLGSGLHQLPFHFYGGYTPQWYEYFGEKCSLRVAEITPNGGFFKLLAQECARVAWTFDQHRHLHGDQAETIYHLFNEWLPRYLYWMDERCLIPQFTVGYHVEMVLTTSAGESLDKQVNILETMRRHHRSPDGFVALAQEHVRSKDYQRARRYVQAALALAPIHSEAKALLETLPHLESVHV